MNLHTILRPGRALLATTLVAASIGATCMVAAAATGSPAKVSVVQSATTTATSVTIGTRTHVLNGKNRSRLANELVQYGPANGAARTGTNMYGTEVAIVSGKITKVERRVGNMAIPTGGYVLSGHGTAAQWLDDNARLGSSVTRNWDTTTPDPVPPTPAPAPTDSYAKALASVAGLTHYYPLDAANQARDAVGNVDGTLKGSGVTFTNQGAVLTGKGFIELPDHNDFSVATKGGFTVLLDLTVDSWRGAGASEYVHWMGKGVSGAHEWTFRHYVQGGSGEASSRQGRVSFYHFNPAGGLGAGSYFQDPMTSSESVVGATGDNRQVQMYKNGKLRDTDALSGYSIVPKNTSTPVRIGSRGDNTGFLVGKVRRVAFFNRVLTATEMQRLSTAATQ